MNEKLLVREVSWNLVNDGDYNSWPTGSDCVRAPSL
jgi:hypothetical protein